MTQDQPKLRRCPKCRSAAIVLIEIGTVGISFEQTVRGRWRRIDGDWNAEPFKVDASCRTCSHGWTLRNRICLPCEDAPWRSGKGITEDPTIKP